MKREEMPFIKICGIKDAETAVFLFSLQVDAVGFISYKRSPRYISAVELGGFLSECESDGKEKVGVFVNESIDTVKAYRDAGITVAQLHGEENESFAEQCAELGLKVWKALRPRDESDIDGYINYPAERFLIDAFKKGVPGGTGEQVNRNLALYGVKTLPAPVILAGGITPENALDIYRNVMPFGLDVNSGVESEPGVKDRSRIISLLNLWHLSR
jgi:phosphoribosylanthranilate isomerase